jgi:hypothetical protein
MAMFRKAERRKQKLRLALIGPSGSGKTFSALKIAFGLGNKTVLIDTENGSGDLYDYLGEYDVFTFSPPFDPDELVKVMQAAEQEGYDTIIVDSLSHFWSGEGGMLDIVNGLGGKFSDWKKANPKHQHLLDAILRSKSHVIATMRSKTEYIVTEEEQKNGFKKQKVEKAGTSAIQREGLEFELTVVLNLNMQHIAEASKDRTGLFDGNYTKLDENVGKRLLEWLEKGIEQPKPMRTDQKQKINDIAKKLNMTGTVLREHCLKLYDTATPNEQQADEVIEWLETGLAAINETAAAEQKEEATA